MTPTENMINMPTPRGEWRGRYATLLENAWTAHVVDVPTDERANELALAVRLAEEIRYGLAAGLLGYSLETPAPAAGELHYDGGRCYCRYGGDGRQINIDNRCIDARRAAFSPGAGPTGQGDDDLAAAARSVTEHAYPCGCTNPDLHKAPSECRPEFDERDEPNGEQADPIVPNRRTCDCRGCTAARGAGIDVGA